MRGTLRFSTRSVIFAAAGFLILAGAPGMAQDIIAAEPKVATTTPQARTPQRATPKNYTQVYLLRGLLNVFSLGMDDLAQKLEKRGVRTSVHNHAEWQSLADEITARYRAGNRAPVVLIGHSLGADAVMHMGDYLGQQKVPVALIVPFDGTGSFEASANVRRVMNVTQRDYAHMRKGPGFRGELVNVDVSGQGYGHTDIDKAERLHNMVIKKVMGVLGGGGGATASPKSAPATASDVSASSATASPATSAASAEDKKPAAAQTN